MINKYVVITHNDEKKILKFDNSETYNNKYKDCFSKISQANTKYIYQRLYNAFEKKVYYKKMYDSEIFKSINSFVDITFLDGVKKTGFLKRDVYSHKLFLSKTKYTRGNVLIDIETVDCICKIVKWFYLE